jgi:hypothetical protein
VLERGLVAEDEAGKLDRRVRREGLLRRADRDRRGELDRKAVRAGRDRRKGDRPAAVLVRELDSASSSSEPPRQIGPTAWKT